MNLVQDFQNPRPATLKSINKRRFLEELRVRGPSTRAELTRAIGVAPPTSSSIIADLMEAGFLEMGGGTQSLGKGRPGTFFRLASTTAFVIGATLDIAECQVMPSGLDGVPVEEAAISFATPKTYSGLISTLKESIQQIGKNATGKCLGVGLAVPGLLDNRKHRVSFSPNMHMLDGHDLGADLQADTPFRVVCTQEEHALCLSQQLRGATEGLADFAVVDFSSGVGMGVVSTGRYISGAHGYAGEVGHTTVEPNGILCGCGNRGCLETVASDRALLNAVGQRVGKAVTFDEISERWGAGDAAVQEEVDKALSYIAIGLATVVNLFNPRVIFVNGRIFTLGEDVLTKLNRLVEARALRPSFANVQLRTTTGDKMHGAIAGLLDNVFAEVGPRLD